jgi:sugar/nucleoside kinase (ribokinase family)
MAQNGVVCIGLVVMDILAKPVDPGFHNHDVIMVDKISWAVGGDAFNEARTLARMGVPVKLMSSVGADIWGDFIMREGNEAVIDMENVTRNCNYQTSISIVLIQHNGERNFICAEGTAKHFMMESLDMPSIEKAKIISLASLYPNPEMDQAFLTAAKAAKKNGAIVTVDIAENLDVNALNTYAELLPLVDFIFPNYDEACSMTGQKDPEKIADVFLKSGVKNVVIKTGKTGCYIQTAAEEFTVPTYKNAKRVDTTGAGDNFAAGFIYGLARDLPVRECAAYANAAASVSIQYIGAGGVRNIQEIEDMMAGEVLL